MVCLMFISLVLQSVFAFWLGEMLSSKRDFLANQVVSISITALNLTKEQGSEVKTAVLNWIDNVIDLARAVLKNKDAHSLVSNFLFSLFYEEAPVYRVFNPFAFSDYSVYEHKFAWSNNYFLELETNIPHPPAV